MKNLNLFALTAIFLAPLGSPPAAAPGVQSLQGPQRASDTLAVQPPVVTSDSIQLAPGGPPNVVAEVAKMVVEVFEAVSGMGGLLASSIPQATAAPGPAPRHQPSLRTGSWRPRTKNPSSRSNDLFTRGSYRDRKGPQGGHP